MKFLYLPFLLAFVLFACKNQHHSLNEDYQAFGFVSQKEMNLNEHFFLTTQRFHFILFLYHDTVFQVERSDTATNYSFLTCTPTTMTTLKSVFTRYSKTTLKRQLANSRKTNHYGNCSPEGYFYFKKNGKPNFGLFYFADYLNWIGRHRTQQIRLTKETFPKIYSDIYNGLNSNQWDYYMGDDYYFPNSRSYQQFEFLQKTS